MARFDLIKEYTPPAGSVLTFYAAGSAHDAADKLAIFSDRDYLVTRDNPITLGAEKQLAVYFAETTVDLHIEHAIYGAGGIWLLDQHFPDTYAAITAQVAAEASAVATAADRVQTAADRVQTGLDVIAANAGAAAATGMGYPTRALMDAAAGLYTEGQVVRVTNDPTPANNGDWIKGASVFSPSSFDRVAVVEADISAEKEAVRKIFVSKSIYANKFFPGKAVTANGYISTSGGIATSIQAGMRNSGYQAVVEETEYLLSGIGSGAGHGLAAYDANFVFISMIPSAAYLPSGPFQLTTPVGCAYLRWTLQFNSLTDYTSSCMLEQTSSATPSAYSMGPWEIKPEQYGVELAEIAEGSSRTIIKAPISTADPVLTASSPEGSVFEDSYDNYAFSGWGQKMAAVDVAFNTVEIPVEFKKAFTADCYMDCYVKDYSGTLVEKVSLKISDSPLFNKRLLSFHFTGSYNLLTGIILDIQTVDSGGNRIKCGLGIYLIQDMDTNSFTGSIDSIRYSSVTGVYQYMGIAQTKPYFCFYYTLKNSSASQKFLEYKALNAVDSLARQSIVEINVAVETLNGLTYQAPLSSPASNILTFRPSASNSTVYASAYFMGRWFPMAVGGTDYMVTINQGAEIFAKFTGSSLVGIFNDVSSTPPSLAVSIDGGAFERVFLENSTVLVAGLSDSEHYVRLMVDGINESDDVWSAGQGVVFQGFVVDGGKTITPIKPLNKVAWFIGDSITAGINVLGVGSNPTVNSASGAYPHVTCNTLGLGCVRIGFGATGVTKAGSGGVPSAINYIDYMMSGVLETADEPDIIIINHGTNDSAATTEVFSAAYHALLARLSIKFPGVYIFCMRPFNGVRSTEIAEAVDGFPCCLYVDTFGWGVTYSDGGHPDVAGGIAAGLRLAEEIRTTLKNYSPYWS